MYICARTYNMYMCICIYLVYISFKIVLKRSFTNCLLWARLLTVLVVILHPYRLVNLICPPIAHHT